MLMGMAPGAIFKKLSFRPQPGQIEQYQREDDARAKDRIDVRHSVNQAKRDLKSGKVVVDPSCSTGGVVVPRSATQSKNPHRASSEFVHKVLAKRMARG